MRKKSELYRRAELLAIEKPTLWRMLRLSALGFIDLTSVCTMAVLIAVCAVLGMLTLPVMGNLLQIRFTYLIYALVGTLFGPVMGAFLGICDQLLVETLLKGNGILPGYIISFAIRGAIYGFLLYYPRLYARKRRLSVLRMSAVKLTDTVLNNILMNTYLLYHYKFINADSFFVAVTVRIGKNIILLPLEIALMCIFMSAMLRMLPKLGLLSEIECPKITGRQIAVISAIACAGMALLLVYLFCPQFREVLKFGIR